MNGYEDFAIRTGSAIVCKECGAKENTMTSLDKHIYQAHHFITIGGMGIRPKQK
jgi:hypothetical protein